MAIKKSAYLFLSILDVSAIAMPEYWYDYAKERYRGNTKLCHLDRESFIAQTRKRRC